MLFFRVVAGEDNGVVGRVGYIGIVDFRNYGLELLEDCVYIWAAKNTSCQAKLR